MSGGVLEGGHHVPVGDLGGGPAGRLLPAGADVVGGLGAEADGGVAAQRAEVDPGAPAPAQSQSTRPARVSPTTGRCPATGRRARRRRPPLTAPPPAAPPAPRRPGQQGPRLPAAQGGEVLDGDWPVPPGQRRAGRQLDPVQGGRGDPPQGPQAGQRTPGGMALVPASCSTRIFAGRSPASSAASSRGAGRPWSAARVSAATSVRSGRSSASPTRSTTSRVRPPHQLQQPQGEPPSRSPRDLGHFRPRVRRPDGPAQQVGIERAHGRPIAAGRDGGASAARTWHWWPRGCWRWWGRRQCALEDHQPGTKDPGMRSLVYFVATTLDLGYSPAAIVATRTSSRSKDRTSPTCSSGNSPR